MTRLVIPSAAIVEIVRRALNSERGIKIAFPTEGQAIHFHQRYNIVRAEVVKRDPASEWRTLQMRRDGHELLLEPLDSHILRFDITEI